MDTILKNKPVMKDNKLYFTLIYIVSVLTIIPMLMPVVVAFQSKFTLTENSAEDFYLIFRGLTAVSLAVAVNVLTITKNVSVAAIPSALGAITVIVPFYNCIVDFIDVVEFGNKYSMSIDYPTYILNLLEYALFFALCVFTFLYSTGLLNLPSVILTLSVPAVIAAQYSVIANAVILSKQYLTVTDKSGYNSGVFDIICFAYSVTASLLPLLLVLACVQEPKPKKDKYTPKRFTDENT